MITLTLTREEASAIIKLLGSLTPKEMSEKCVSELHLQTINRIWQTHRHDLPWPNDEFGRPK